MERDEQPGSIGRRRLITRAAAVFALPGFTVSPVRADTRFNLATATIADLNQAIDKGVLTSELLIQSSLARIRTYEPKLHAILSLDPHALAAARKLDIERRRSGRRSPLHGIPILVKDNINTRARPTTLGFYGLKGAHPGFDAAVVRKLRAAGAIILAKTNLSELASGPPMSSLGGQTRNPHNLAYSPAGSSSGTAVGIAAGYAPIGIATDTTGSARWPAATNGVVGMRPTMGLLSAVGVQPNSPTLDTVGVMARSVRDIAVVAHILEERPMRPPLELDPDALRGVRLAFPRSAFSGDDPEIDRLMTKALGVLRESGATVIEVDVPEWLLHLSDTLQAMLVQTESAPALDAYLRASFPRPWPQSHAAILAMSEALLRSPVPGTFPNPGRLDGYRWEAAGPPMDDPVYLAARDQGRAFFRTSLQAIFNRHRVSAMVYPTQTMRINRLGESPRRNARGLFGNFGPVLASIAGWPDISVPGGVTAEGLPMGVSFLAPANCDHQLQSWAFAFEQRMHGLRPPATTPPLPGEQFAY